MTDSNYLRPSSRLAQFPKAGIFLPKYIVACAGKDGKIYPASWESGRVFGVTEMYPTAGVDSGVKFQEADYPVIFTAGAVITIDDQLRLDGTGGGVVVPFNPTGRTLEWATGSDTNDANDLHGLMNELIAGRNCMGFALEAAAASGDTFMGWFKPSKLI